jgi:hypothetical protein
MHQAGNLQSQGLTNEGGSALMMAGLSATYTIWSSLVRMIHSASWHVMDTRLTIAQTAVFLLCPQRRKSFFFLFLATANNRLALSKLQGDHYGSERMREPAGASKGTRRRRRCMRLDRPRIAKPRHSTRERVCERLGQECLENPGPKETTRSL